MGRGGSLGVMLLIAALAGCASAPLKEVPEPAASAPPSDPAAITQLFGAGNGWLALRFKFVTDTAVEGAAYDFRILLDPPPAHGEAAFLVASVKDEELGPATMWAGPAADLAHDVTLSGAGIDGDFLLLVAINGTQEQTWLEFRTEGNASWPVASRTNGSGALVSFFREDSRAQGSGLSYANVRVSDDRARAAADWITTGGSLRIEANHRLESRGLHYWRGGVGAGSLGMRQAEAFVQLTVDGVSAEDSRTITNTGGRQVFEASASGQEIAVAFEVRSDLHVQSSTVMEALTVPIDPAILGLEATPRIVGG